MTNSSKLNTCDCCAGIEVQTPVKANNLPGQGALSYRIGQHSQFKESMIQALAKSENKALQSLGTRDDDDFTIAYLDGVASVLDVLSFYQERYINENFLATSTERRSVLEMASLIGYELSPGVAASTYLAFSLQTTPGIADSEIEPITIDVGTRVQSVPGQDETPQIFETSESIEARAEWNAVAVQTMFPYIPASGDNDLYINGVANNIDVGDAILLVGQSRLNNRSNERWDIRIVNQVEINTELDVTRLIWEQGLGHSYPKINPADTNVQLFVFRQRESLFGHNAPDKKYFVEPDTSSFRTLSMETELSIEDVGFSTGSADWDLKIKNNQIDLANPHKKIVAGSWIALVSNDADFGSADLPGYVELYRVKSVAAMSRSDYGISGKITRIEPDTTENLEQFNDLRKTLALVESEAITLHARLLLSPLYGDNFSLEKIVEDLVPGQYLSLTGVKQRLKVAPGKINLAMVQEEKTITLNEGDSLILTAIPQKIELGIAIDLSVEDFALLINNNDSTTQLKLKMIDNDGVEGSVTATADNWSWDSVANDPRVSEVVQINTDDGSIVNDRVRTSIILSSALKNIYQRNSVKINFNVAPANHGETVSEILGSGDARMTNQSFLLKQAPLTYVSADTPSGSTAALEVRVNDLLWAEKSTLYQAEKDERVYQVKNHDDGTSSIIFGDGVEGGRLPTGQTNIRASYRKYIGSEANLDSHKLTTLLQKPLGVSEVTNPEPSTGGADPELIDDAKQNAPLTVLTLDRAVSVKDYQDYARAFAGVAKAHTLWVSSGRAKGIYLTIAGVDGTEIPTNSDTYTNLAASLVRYGDPLIPLNIVNHISTHFYLALAVKINEDAIVDDVMETLENQLRDYYSFAHRDFGQNVTQDEVMAVAHSVENIEAVRITRFYKQGSDPNVIASTITSLLPIATLNQIPSAAEILTLSSDAMQLEQFK
ncbi:baseplate J/gp47 family protein [Aliikangiella sp. IMCC44359]|uniref:baseplate J/gp47 family protein n=1 Tax=Aliikangiella sp. IMCC44359 TaxID=3459125 RepID=UPI00403AAE58